MSAARELLAELAKIGATVGSVGDRLILRAGSTAIPSMLVNRVRTAKADLIAALTHYGPNEQAAFGDCRDAKTSIRRSKPVSLNG